MLVQLFLGTSQQGAFAGRGSNEDGFFSSALDRKGPASGLGIGSAKQDELIARLQGIGDMFKGFILLCAS